MSFIVKIVAGQTAYPAVEYAELDAALFAVENALSKNYFREGALTVQLGEGSLLQILSLQELSDQKSDDRTAARSAGMLAPERLRAKAAFKLVVQYGGMQFALDFETKEKADEAVNLALQTGVFSHMIKTGHDYLYIQTRSGTSYLIFTAEEYGQQLRFAQEQAMRQAAQQQIDAKPTPKIII